MARFAKSCALVCALTLAANLALAQGGDMRVQVTTGSPGSLADTVVEASSARGGSFTEELTINGETLYFNPAGADVLLRLYQENRDSGIAFHTFETGEDSGWMDDIFEGTSDPFATGQPPGTAGDDREMALEWNTMWRGQTVQAYNVRPDDIDTCASHCERVSACKGWTLRHNGQCLLFSQITGQRSMGSTVSGSTR